ncbi:class I SAM-dependent methyltransferase [Priestia sp. Y58]|uniref:class I SAM-dependent methyltransferase n=1 Tax=Priestia TaxID=2800373 RepID=UPI001C8DD05B|nr:MULTISPECIES: class I SAM-dependent methyltransferase [Priestia]MBX9987383.1 class I SAM-dependent methyltransferase [Priestia aryabhattai]MBX9998744.1 class I SAM-dependent methyltransferase [Priestia aryabhattai]MCZ8494424.1 class I SAM-dependent methyltransferase [Priestia megaterium]MDG0032195.1 class I SAM-dependent methyltransferase [Priestia sp. Y58]MDG0060198.1 class I SAM-dependent methyltransferase [Priestia sp. P5]
MNDYYGQLCTRVYESDKSFANRKELEFYLSFVKDQNMKVLEPMCGSGRMLIPFMQNGIKIEGFDISKEMLKTCIEKAETLSLKPNVWYQDVESFKSSKKYDLIMIPFGSFSLLADDIAVKSLQNMRAVLKEDGKILLTIMKKKSEIEELVGWTETDRVSFDKEIIVVYKKSCYDKRTSSLNTKIRYELLQGNKTKKVEIMDFPLRLYGSEEFESILNSNGFNNLTVHEVKDGYGEGISFFVYECRI